MDLHESIINLLTDDRFLFNLIAVHCLLAATLIVSMLVKHALVQGSGWLVQWTGLHWLDGLGKEAVRRVRNLLFWTTLGLMLLIAAAGVVYHVHGNDVRDDVVTWYERLSAYDLVRFGFAASGLAALMLGTWLAMRYVRRFRLYLQTRAPEWLQLKEKERSLQRWFFFLERYALAIVALSSLWIAGHIVGLGDATKMIVGFALHFLTILSAAHLLTLATRALSQTLAHLGSRHLSDGRYRRYWERVTRLFPFGERCFEAAIYVAAASMCIRMLESQGLIADFGDRIVFCIGIFFGTRVVIELLHVLLNEAFGIYSEEREFDQKGQTLVPLIQSIGQYVLYFGSGIMMLGVLQIDTTPILAGAGILGLAVGLGSQSLITDVVSGFFILFENHYLVGDFVKIGDASGRVEAVSIRNTQIRDDQGRLHIIPNGQIKGVINYSKGYINAEVDMRLPASANLEEVYRLMSEAGRRLRQTRKEVLGDTVIKGLVELGPSDITVRAVTRVQPGTHQAMQYEYRRLLKEVFDQHKAGPRAAA